MEKRLSSYTHKNPRDSQSQTTHYLERSRRQSIWAVHCSTCIMTPEWTVKSEYAAAFPAMKEEGYDPRHPTIQSRM